MRMNWYRKHRERERSRKHYEANIAHKRKMEGNYV